ncbi:MAG: hypothetical protein HDS81_07435 [Bacteroidales bacterium]|nr:hypothetical protein [Bacteroidales bacterium]
MKLRLTQAQMNERWLALRRLNTMPLEAVVKRNDGVDMDMIVTEEVKKWYFNLLLTADERMLVTHDIEDALDVHPDGRGGAEVVVPPEVVRIISVRMRGWHAPARIVHDNALTDSALHRLRIRQASKLTMSGPDNPVAMMHSNVIRIYPYIDGDELHTLRAVVMTDDLYEFDSSALTTIIEDEQKYDFTI